MTTRPSPADRRAVVYGAALGARGGTGVYLSRLLKGFSELGLDWIRVSLRGRLLTPGEALGEAPRGGAGKALDELLISPLTASIRPRPVVHLPAFSGRAPAGSPVVLTLHDLAFMAGPSWFPLIKGMYYRIHFPEVARRASIVMADSAFTAREATRLLGIPADRLRVVHLSAGARKGDGERFRRQFGLESRYILSVSTIEPRKNIAGLLDAWTGIREARPDLMLVVAGRWGWGSRALRETLLSASGVVWTGPLKSEELADAFSGAELLVYPSLYEGFGLPPLEAASAGVASVLGPAEALGEVYGSSGSTFCGGSPDSIRTAVLEALESARDPAMLKAFAEGFSDGVMAGRVAGIYREVMQ